MLIFQGSFTLVLQACIYRGLIKITLYYFLSPCSSNIQQLMIHYICILMSCFTIFHSLNISFPFLPPIVPSDRPNTILFSLTIYKCICTYKYDPICIYVDI
jgi:hypothetical protein